MSRLTKRILIGFGVLLLVGGVSFYYVVYWSSGMTLQRAEEFLFRRMTVAQLNEKAAYRFFFVTNRAVTDSDAPLDKRFSAERQESLRFGLFDTRIEPTVGLGMFINPSEWFQKTKKFD